HTKFVLTNLFGRIVAWRSPPRGEQETSWSEATRRHGFTTILGSVWGASVYWLNPGYFWWLTPIVGALIVSVPLSVLMSRVRLGRRTRAAGLFRTPEETDPPLEVAEIDEALAAARRKEQALEPVERDGFVRAIVDPYVNALRRWFLRRPRSLAASVRERRRKLVERALAGGPGALALRERRIVLMDAERLEELHRRVWELPSAERARSWGRPAKPATEATDR
ncbi:MAG: glucans biosynthesis glucosyltransferase MdoH, partial [Candidatus Binatia bacterium]